MHKCAYANINTFNLWLQKNKKTLPKVFLSKVIALCFIVVLFHIFPLHKAFIIYIMQGHICTCV